MSTLIKTVPISLKGQFTIPMIIRNKFGIKPGDKVILDIRHDREGVYLVIAKQ
jgi:AbrB family looped-hinge helix DNA binding protein